MIDPQAELNSEKDVINTFFEYITNQGSGVYELVHSPQGTWLHLDNPDYIRISGWSYPDRSIDDKCVAYPSTAREIAVLILQIEDASRIVSRDPEDPYYTEEDNDYQHDQKRYRFSWDEQKSFSESEISTAMLNFHNNYSKLINGEVW